MQKLPNFCRAQLGQVAIFLLELRQGTNGNAMDLLSKQYEWRRQKSIAKRAAHQNEVVVRWWNVLHGRLQFVRVLMAIHADMNALSSHNSNNVSAITPHEINCSNWQTGSN